MSSDFIDSNISDNRRQSVVLILGMVVILTLLGGFLGGTTGVVVAVGLCILAAVFGPAVSPQIVLRMYKAQPIGRGASPQLHDLFTDLSRRAELETPPQLYYVPSRTLNAFAVGNRSNSAVAITDGLLRMLNAQEIAGVLAHEISHIKHRDMFVLGIADTVSRTIGTISQIGQFVLLLGIADFLMLGGYKVLFVALVLIASPMLSNLLQLALSRSREFNADLGAVALTRDAKGLASALAKLERITSGTGFPWGIPGRRGNTVPAVLRTHPPTDERIRRILAAGESLGLAPTGDLIEPIHGRRLSPTDVPRVRRGPRWHVAGLWY